MPQKGNADWVTVSEAAEILPWCVGAIRNMCKRGEIRTIRAGQSIRLSREDIDRIMQTPAYPVEAAE